MIDKLVVGNLSCEGYETAFLTFYSLNPVRLVEITTAHKPYGDFITIGYVYEADLGEELVCRWNKHGVLVQALLEARALILEAQHNSHVLDRDGTDCMLEMIREALGDENQAD